MWFKIDESGKDEDGLWAAPDRLMANLNQRLYDVDILRNSIMRQGQYIIWHEM